MNIEIQQENNQNEHIISNHSNVLTLEQIAIRHAQNVGNKATNLAELHSAGFPVPVAVAVTAEAHLDYMNSGLIDSNLIRELERIRAEMGGNVAVRSSATCEDGDELSMAGVFDTYYLQNETETIEDAIKRIYEQSNSDTVKEYLNIHGLNGQKVEMGIILQKLIEPDISGVIYTDVDDSHTLIQYTNGFGNKLVDGLSEGASVLYSPDVKFVTKSKNTDLIPLSYDEIKRLDSLAFGIKQAFAKKPQDIEFAIKNGKIYVLQARPLTTEVSGVNLELSGEDVISYTKDQLNEIIQQEKRELGSNSVILSDSNFSELLPKPKEMDFGVFAYIFTGSDGVPGAIQLGRQQMGYPLGNESVGFMYYIGGKPYFSIARDAHTFYAGFPDSREEYSSTLVAEYLNEVNLEPSKGEYPEMGLYMQDPSLEYLVERFGEKGKDYYEKYLEFKQRMGQHAGIFMNEYLSQGKPETDNFILEMSSTELKNLTNNDLINHANTILEHLRTVSCVHFVKSARLGFYYSQRLQQMLKDNFNMSQDQVESTFSLLNQGLDGSEITQANLKIAQASTIDEAIHIGRTVVGHYSTGEMLEIRHPRLKDDKNALRQYVEGIFGSKDQYISEFSRQKNERLQAEEEFLKNLRGTSFHDEFAHVLQAAQTYMALRETVKYQFVKEYDLFRDALTEISNRTGASDGDIFSLFPRELASYIENVNQFKAKIVERQERFNQNIVLHLPSVIRESDVQNIGTENEDDLESSEFLGKLLSQGKTIEEATIVNIDNFDTLDDARETIQIYKSQDIRIILVASQMNLSHDPFIVQADGLVIENAGIVSHGAQRARELGKGAIGGIKSSRLLTGIKVFFDPSNRLVKKIEQT